MKHLLKKTLLFGIFNLVLVMGWIALASCFNSTPAANNQTVYAGVLSVSGLSGSLSAGPIRDADIHVQGHDDLEHLVTTPYSLTHGTSYMYIEAKVSSSSCADHDHIGSIVRSGSTGDYAIGVTANISEGGTLSIELKSQCEQNGTSMGDGVYYKGSQWFGANNYPLSPDDNIVVDVATQVSCQYAGDKKQNATEYGCGGNDAS